MATYDDFFGGTTVEAGPGPRPPGIERTPEEEEAARRAAKAWARDNNPFISNVSTYDRDVSQASSPEQQAAAHATGNFGATAGYYAGDDTTRAAYDHMYDLSKDQSFGVSFMGGKPLRDGQEARDPFDVTFNGGPPDSIGPEGVEGYDPLAKALKEGTGLGGGGGPAGDMSAALARGEQLGANAANTFGTLGARRENQGAQLFSEGAAVQGREAQLAANVNYGPAAKIGPIGTAQVGNYGTQQNIQAPTLASAQQAAMGNFGGPQTVRAQQAQAQQSQAQQAQAYQAANQAGFLGGTAQQARNVADLDFTQANQARGEQAVSLDRLRGFVDQGPGPSVAQQQLRQAQEQNLGAALSLARSGRGNAAGNMKNAISENAATNAQTNQQAALLRAQEATDWRGQQLQAYGMEQGATAGIRQQDLGAAQAQGQQAISREQIAANVDVQRAGLEQGLAQFNAGAQNQASLTNAQLGTQSSMNNAQLGTQASMTNAELGTQASMTQASLGNALNIAQGQAGTQVNLQNAEQSNIGNRLQGQLSFDAASQTAQLANAHNLAVGNAGTQVSTSNAANQTQAALTQAELQNQMGIAQGNSNTTIGMGNAQLGVQQTQANDAYTQAMYGYGLDANQQALAAANYGAGYQRDYHQIAAELQAEMEKAAAIRNAATVGGIAAVTEAIL